MIVGRQLLSLQWRGQLLMPMFQFHAADMSVHEVVTSVIEELGCALDDWELCAWFTQANGWLDDRRPIDLLVTGGAAVKQAARGDRFVTQG